MLKIYTDTDTDFTPTLAAEYGYKLISMPYSVDAKTTYPYIDFDEFDSHKFYDMLRAGTMPTTSAMSEEAYIQYFEPEFAAGNDILYVHFSAGTSNTFTITTTITSIITITAILVVTTTITITTITIIFVICTAQRLRTFSFFTFKSCFTTSSINLGLSLSLLEPYFLIYKVIMIIRSYHFEDLVRNQCQGFLWWSSG